MMKIFGLSRTRDRNGKIVKRNLKPWVNCIHTPAGWETMQVLIVELEDE